MRRSSSRRGALARAVAGVVAAALVAGAAAAAEARRTSAQAPKAKAPPADEAIHYVVRSAPSADLQLTPPPLPDLSGYTGAAIDAKVPRKPGAKVSTGRMAVDSALKEFVGGAGRLGEWASRQSSNPIAIFIEGGTMTPRDLARALPKEQFEQTSPGVYMLRLPLVVRPGAALHIDRSTKEFRLSQERGAFLVNDGQMYVTGTRLVAWRENENAPARFRRPNEFRPFLISWGGSQLYIADSVVESLGYEASKSYGISISQYSPHQDARLRRARPTGWIVNSEIFDNWFGFYCYEADDIVIVRNNFHNNIIYGIDPHDRSRGLIIAHNNASGLPQKHGIIISREVNDSWIFNNRTSDNRLGGIVIDRNSVHNVIAYNDSVANYGDGITIYESPNNLLWENRSMGNARHGIRMRNSVDVRLYRNISVANKLSGIYGHIKDLSGTDRDLKLDPFDLEISMVVVGGQLIYNGSGPVSIDRPLSVELYDVDLLAPTKSVGIQMTGVLGQYQDQILDILVRQRAAAIIEPVENDSAPAGG